MMLLCSKNSATAHTSTEERWNFAYLASRAPHYLAQFLLWCITFFCPLCHHILATLAFSWNKEAIAVSQGICTSTVLAQTALPPRSSEIPVDNSRTCVNFAEVSFEYILLLSLIFTGSAKKNFLGIYLSSLVAKPCSPLLVAFDKLTPAFSVLQGP